VQELLDNFVQTATLSVAIKKKRNVTNCHNLSLGLDTKARACKGASQE
jgi:hypothetical protein